MRTAFLTGLALWLIGTLAIRLGGRALLVPGRPLFTAVLYAASFVLMVFCVPGIFHSLKLEKDSWLPAVTLLILPTLVLDSLACLFFPVAYPNIAPAAAGLFGGWMLIFCAGAVVGVWLRK